MLLAWRVTTLSAIKTQRGWHKWGVGVVVEREPKKSSTTSAGLTEAVPFHSPLYKRMALLHHCTGRSFSSPWVLLYVSRKCFVWCKRLSKKVKIRIIIIKKKTEETDTERPPNTNFSSLYQHIRHPCSDFCIASFFFSMYINKKNTFIQVIWEQVFFSSLFFCTQKNYKKAPKSTIESACRWPGLWAASWPRAGHLHKTGFSYIFPKYGRRDAVTEPCWHQPGLRRKLQWWFSPQKRNFKKVKRSSFQENVTFFPFQKQKIVWKKCALCYVHIAHGNARWRFMGAHSHRTNAR